MTTLSAPQLAAYAKSAGFSGKDIAIAVAVALAESGGRTDAINRNNSDGSVDHGLWQINSVHSALLASGNWANPTDNARMAYTVFKGSGWGAWTTFNSGAYLSHLSVGRSAVQNPGTVTAVKPVIKGPYPVTHTGSNPSDLTWTITIMGIKHNINGMPNDLRKPTLDAKQTASVVGIPGSAFPVMYKWAKAHDSTGKLDSRYLPGNYKVTAAGVTPFNRWAIVVAYCYAAAEPSAPTGPSLNDLNNSGDILGAVGRLIDFLTNPKNWIRLGYFAVGGILVLVAAYQVSSSSIPNVLKTAVKVVA